MFKKLILGLVIFISLVSLLDNENLFLKYKKYLDVFFRRSSIFYIWPHLNEKIPFNDLDYHKDSSLVFITYGQSNAANSGELKSQIQPHKNVYMVFNENIYKYKDPSLGSDGIGNSVWGLLGEKLVFQNNEEVKNVFFTNTAVGGEKIENLISSEFEYLTFFLNQFKMTLKKFEKVDGILFHQGESNRYNIKSYQKSFMTFIDSVRSVSNVPIYLSLASYCNGSFNNKLLQIQNNLIENNENILRGPNSDILGSEFRHDDCHFNEEGLIQLANLWSEAIFKSSEL